MIPSYFVLLDDLPLTPTGKLDREKLRQIVPGPSDQRHDDLLQTEIGLQLAEIWLEAFELSNVGGDDDFFALGGDSLVAALIAARVHAAFGVELHLGFFTDHPRLADFAASVESVVGPAIPDDTQRLIRVPRDGTYPLSFAQERIWKYSQTPNDSASYETANIDRIVGRLNVDILRDCLSYIVGRHEILRTSFQTVDGQPVQIVHPPAALEIPFLDVAGAADAERRARQFFVNEAALRFDLARPPLLRFSLVRIRDGEYWLRRTIHHIIWDGFSKKRIFFRELASLYEARLRGSAYPLLEYEPLQYVDYAVWQRNALRAREPAYNRTLAWWKDVLSNAPPTLALPFKRSEPGDRSPADGNIDFELGIEITGRLEELRRKEGVTHFMIWLATFVAMIAVETGQRDVVIGTYVDNRRRMELQNMQGPFMNLATLRFRYDWTTTFSQWLAIVRKTVVEAQVHSDIPYEQLREELAREGVTVPEINAIFVVSYRQTETSFAGLSFSSLDWRNENMPWGFTMHCDDQAGKHGWTTFNARLYDPGDVRAFIDRYRRMLDTLSRQPNLPLDLLLAMSEV